MPGPAEAPYFMAMEPLCRKLVTGRAGQALLSSRLIPVCASAQPVRPQPWPGHCLPPRPDTPLGASVSPKAEGSLPIALNCALLGGPEQSDLPTGTLRNIR